MKKLTESQLRSITKKFVLEQIDDWSAPNFSDNAGGRKTEKKTLCPECGAEKSNQNHLLCDECLPPEVDDTNFSDEHFSPDDGYDGADVALDPVRGNMINRRYRN